MDKNINIVSSQETGKKPGIMRQCLGFSKEVKNNKPVDIVRMTGNASNSILSENKRERSDGQ